jgi:hypothetical protein
MGMPNLESTFTLAVQARLSKESTRLHPSKPRLRITKPHSETIQVEKPQPVPKLATDRPPAAKGRQPAQR